MVTPYEQARDYVSQLSLSEKPRYIITCNFQKIRIYDCNIQPSYNRKTDTWYAPFEEIELKDLVTEYKRLNFLVNVEDQNIKKEMEISIQAGDLVGIIYDELLKQYKNPDDPETQKSLNQLCVRFVFCFYAEDADSMITFRHIGQRQGRLLYGCSKSLIQSLKTEIHMTMKTCWLFRM